MKIESVSLLKEERELEKQLKDAPLPERITGTDLRTQFSWGVAILLTLAGFAFSLIAFTPFRLGGIQYLYCAGIAILVPFVLEKLLTVWSDRKLMKSLVLLAALASIASVMLLAVIRGGVLGHELTASNSSVVIDDAPGEETPQSDFYTSMLPLLRLVMMLLALAMELAAGLALHDAMPREDAPATDWETPRNRLEIVRRRLVAIAEEVVALKNEPEVVANRFWRNFHRTITKHLFYGAMSKLVLLAVMILGGLHASAEEHTTIIIALDLTQSVARAGPDSATDFQKNVQGVARLLREAPISSRIVILGITGKSFREPYVLLSARVADDPGFFGERLRDARNALIREWKRRSRNLAPRFPYTDIMGAMHLATQIFDESPQTSRKMLIIFSDMRHHTPDLDLESGEVVSGSLLRKQSQEAPPAVLQGIEVYALGVNGAGKSAAYWESLQRFWTEYVHHAGAVLVRYTPLRDMPQIGK